MTSADWWLDTLFPPACAGCGVLGYLVCPLCHEQIEFLSLPIELIMPVTLKVLAATQYQYPISTIIHRLKYQSLKTLSVWAAQFIYTHSALPPCDLITSVPIHSSRQRQRGFNQAEEIAKELAKLLEKPYLPLLSKQAQTVAQASLSDTLARQKNVVGAFTLSSFAQKHQTSLMNKSVLLLDDVVTTGATMGEAAQVLQSHLQAKVTGVTLAHES